MSKKFEFQWGPHTVPSDDIRVDYVVDDITGAAAIVLRHLDGTQLLTLPQPNASGQ